MAATITALRSIVTPGLGGSSTRARDRYTLGVRSINTDDEHADALLCLIRQRLTTGVLSTDRAVELLRPLAGRLQTSRAQVMSIASASLLMVHLLAPASGYGRFGPYQHVPGPSRSLPSHSDWFA